MAKFLVQMKPPVFRKWFSNVGRPLEQKKGSLVGSNGEGECVQKKPKSKRIEQEMFTLKKWNCETVFRSLQECANEARRRAIAGQKEVTKGSKQEALKKLEEGTKVKEEPVQRCGLLLQEAGIKKDADSGKAKPQLEKSQKDDCDTIGKILSKGKNVLVAKKKAKSVKKTAKSGKLKKKGRAKGVKKGASVEETSNKPTEAKKNEVSGDEVCEQEMKSEKAIVAGSDKKVDDNSKLAASDKDKKPPAKKPKKKKGWFGFGSKRKSAVKKKGELCPDKGKDKGKGTGKGKGGGIKCGKDKTDKDKKGVADPSKDIKAPKDDKLKGVADPCKDKKPPKDSGKDKKDSSKDSGMGKKAPCDPPKDQDSGKSKKDPCTPPKDKDSGKDKKKTSDPCKPKKDPCKDKKDVCDPCKSKKDPCDPCKDQKDSAKDKKKTSDPCKDKKDSDKEKNPFDPCKDKKDSGKEKNPFDPCKDKKDSGKEKKDPCNPFKDKKQSICDKEKEDPCKKRNPCKQNPSVNEQDSGKGKSDPNKDKKNTKRDPFEKDDDTCQFSKNTSVLNYLQPQCSGYKPAQSYLNLISRLSTIHNSIRNVDELFARQPVAGDSPFMTLRTLKDDTSHMLETLKRRVEDGKETSNEGGELKKTCKGVADAELLDSKKEIGLVPRRVEGTILVEEEETKKMAEDAAEVVLNKAPKNVMQQGTNNTHHWELKFPPSRTWENPLMGWCSSADKFAGLKLKFGLAESAAEFCKKKGWETTIEAVPEPKIPIKKDYRSNFSWDRRTRVSTK